MNEIQREKDAVLYSICMSQAYVVSESFLVVHTFYYVCVCVWATTSCLESNLEL